MVRVPDLDPAFVNQFMTPSSPTQTGLLAKPRLRGEFLQQAIANVRKTIAFPSDIHYMIARGGFFSQLSKL
jgi:hypothetical protein